MATLATLTNRILDAAGIAVEAPSRPREHNRLRALPNEDVFFHAKRIDNTTVIRESDPQAAAFARQWMGAASLAAALGIALLLPSAYGMMAGFQAQGLVKEQKALREELSARELELARIESPAALKLMLEKEGFIAPAAANVVYLNPSAQGTMALNANSR